MGKICQYYLKGTCKFGDRCYNEHINPNQQRGFQNDQRGFDNNQRDYHGNKGGGGQYGGRNNYNHHDGHQNTGHRDSGRNQHHHRSTNRFSALSHQTDPEFDPKFHQQRTRTTSSSSLNNQQNTDHSIIDRIKKDMCEWEDSGQWPLSCYAIAANEHCIRGFDDFSPEEIRFNAYEANANGKSQHYLESLHKLLQSFIQKRQEISTISVESLHKLMAQSRHPTTSNGPFGEMTSTSLFGNDTSSTSLFGQPPGSNASSTSLFGQPTGKNTPSTSLFNQTAGKDTSSTSLFGKDNSATSLFGSDTTSTPIFGSNTPSASHSLFPTSSGAPGPFSSSSGTQDEKSMSYLSEEVKEVKQTAAVMKCSEQDINAFKKSTFTLGAIPECPPPPELC